VLSSTPVVSDSSSTSASATDSRTTAADSATSAVLESSTGVSGADLPLIIGATAAGTAVLTALVVLIAVFVCRRKKRDDDDDNATMGAGASREMSSARADGESPYGQITSFQTSYALVDPAATSAQYDDLTLGNVYDAPPITGHVGNYSAPPPLTEEM
jgi:hypothetical protein